MLVTLSGSLTCQRQCFHKDGNVKWSHSTIAVDCRHPNRVVGGGSQSSDSVGGDVCWE